MPLVAVQWAQIGIGARVVTDGLRNSKLNKKAATVVRWDAAQQRYELRIDGLDDTRMRKSANVLPIQSTAARDIRSTAIRTSSCDIPADLSVRIPKAMLAQQFDTGSLGQKLLTNQIRLGKEKEQAVVSVDPVRDISRGVQPFSAAKVNAKVRLVSKSSAASASASASAASDLNIELEPRVKELERRLREADRVLADKDQLLATLQQVIIDKEQQLTAMQVQLRDAAKQAAFPDADTSQPDEVAKRLTRQVSAAAHQFRLKIGAARSLRHTRMVQPLWWLLSTKDPTTCMSNH